MSSFEQAGRSVLFKHIGKKREGIKKFNGERKRWAEDNVERNK